MVLMAPRWPRNVRKHLAVSSDHALAVQSPEPVTMMSLAMLISCRRIMNTFIRQMAVKNRQCVRQTDKHALQKLAA